MAGLWWLLALAAAVTVNTQFTTPKAWEADYAFWRFEKDGTDAQTSFASWRSRFPEPQNKTPSFPEFDKMPLEEKRSAFYNCTIQQALKFSQHVMSYRSPSLRDVQTRVRRELDAVDGRVALGVFWGRFRYVTILWPYIERNLRVNGGILDEVILPYMNRSAAEGADGNREFLTAIVEKYPQQVRAVPFCAQAFGCAFHEIFTDPKTVYLKIDDDTAFIKDGSFEHMVLETLINKDYSFFAGAVVNHPHTSAVHRYVGALPPQTYHWEAMAKATPPFYDVPHVPVIYYGKNLWDTMGSPAHEGFIYNIANNRLDVYTFDVWNMNECRCPEPQEGYLYCDKEGYYRWGINAIAWTTETIKKFRGYVPPFDEPVVSMDWARMIPPHRTGLLGEPLFVHVMYTKQRHAKSYTGHREDVLLPWYAELARQYTATPYGEWKGNRTLLLLYEDMQAAVQQRRNVGRYWTICRDSRMMLERERCELADNYYRAALNLTMMTCKK